MLQLSRIFTNRPILSLHTGGQIGMTQGVLLNPDTLKIEGWFATSRSERGEFIVMSSEVRDIISKGIVVNDHNSLTHPDDLVRLQNALEVRFELEGKQVVTESKKKLGRVTDFAVDTDSFLVQKLYVTPSILKSVQGRQLIIGRDQIVELQERKIIVKDASVRAGNAVPAPARA